jgi:hypothetical protein
VVELLILVCSPKMAPLPSAEKEATQVQQLWPGALLMRGGTLEDLQAVMQQHAVRRLAFIGHGDARLGGEKTLGFTTKEGMLSVVSPSTIAELLGAHSPRAGGKLELVFLACGLVKQLAEQIYSAGVLTVCGWETDLFEAASQLFTPAFFESLKKGEGVKQAFEIAKSSVLSVVQDGFVQDAGGKSLAAKVQKYELHDPKASGTVDRLGKLLLVAGADKVGRTAVGIPFLKTTFQ